MKRTHWKRFQMALLPSAFLIGPYANSYEFFRYLIGRLNKDWLERDRMVACLLFRRDFHCLCVKLLEMFSFSFDLWLWNYKFLTPLEKSNLTMGAECGFQTKQQLNECLLRYPWSEHPLPPVHRACRDGNLLSLTYLTIQGDRLEVFRSINEQDQFLMWTPAHWAAYFGKVSLASCTGTAILKS